MLLLMRLRKVQERIGLLMSMMEEAISGLRIIKAFNAEQYQSAHFLKENNVLFQNFRLRRIKKISEQEEKILRYTAPKKA